MDDNNRIEPNIDGNQISVLLIGSNGRARFTLTTSECDTNALLPLGTTYVELRNYISNYILLAKLRM